MYSADITHSLLHQGKRPVCAGQSYSPSFNETLSPATWGNGLGVTYSVMDTCSNKGLKEKNMITYLLTTVVLHNVLHMSITQPTLLPYHGRVSFIPSMKKLKEGQGNFTLYFPYFEAQEGWWCVKTLLTSTTRENSLVSAHTATV